ncbi:Aldo/keto reductase [Aspergillus taichungensis]|uniref:Aldo/keto reductase n=1 Tax=Aspergillus taichungensis TaxID=482145 RepID=A0A2J5HXQ0_9EURO|nr:Aldo/keto reductase [Aspergillus taichungensis]
MSPSYILGTQNFGTSWTETTLPQLVTRLDDAGITHYDTAALYPATNPGQSETLLGQIQRDDVLIDTKILFQPGGLQHDKMEQSLRGSLSRLGVSKVNTLFAHAPDPTTPIAEQAANFDALHRAGLFTSLGLCNYSPAQLTEWLTVSQSQGLIAPTVYQGQYNLLCRGYETSLFPLLRQHGLRFVANSPLAGGFLTGKLTFATGASQLVGTRFEVGEANLIGGLFRAWYDRDVFHEAVRKMREAVAAEGLLGGGEEKEVMARVAMRWVLFHSGLRGECGDAVAVGPGSVRQLETYLDARDEGPLSGELAGVLGGLFEGVKGEAEGIITVGWWSW